MQEVVSDRVERPAARVAAAKTAPVARFFAPWRLHRTARDGTAEMARVFDFSGIRITLVRTGASTLVRTSRMVSRGDPELLMFVLHLDGEYRISQGSRVGVCVAGDMTTIDSSQPSEVQASGSLEVLAFGVPKRLLWPHTERVCAASALRIPGDDPRASLVTPFLWNLASGLSCETLSPHDLALGEVLVSVIRAIALDAASTHPLEPSMPALIKRYIDGHLEDPDLTPEGIARAFFISRRQLYTLFSGQQVGVSGWIRARRLDRCRRDLADPALRDDSILTIATRWGFKDAAHFSRTFSAAFGRSPRAYRHSAAAPVDSLDR